MYWHWVTAVIRMVWHVLALADCSYKTGRVMYWHWVTAVIRMVWHVLALANCSYKTGVSCIGIG
jgi:hypothetical protein